MSGLVLVRHGRPAAGWDADPDPGLDPEGVAQAERMAAALAPSGPLPIVVSPKRRTRETAGCAMVERIITRAFVGAIDEPALLCE